MSQERIYRLQLTGAFHLSAPDGAKLDVRSKKSIALLALLATSDNGERTRGWLQEKLWGSRETHQAQNSLRRELFNLRKLSEQTGLKLIDASTRTVSLCLDNVAVDVRGDFPASPSAELLEGLEIAGERSFGEWLKKERNRLRQPSPAEEHSDNDKVRDPAPAPAGSAEGVTLLIFPFTVAGVHDPPAELAREIAFRLFVEHLGRSKYFSVSMCPMPEDRVIGSAFTSAATTQANARYGVVGQVVNHGGERRFSLSIFRGSNRQILWSGPMPLADDPNSDEYYLAVQRIVNRTIQTIAHDEKQRARKKDPNEADAIELAWLIRFALYNPKREVFEDAAGYIELYRAKYPHDPEPIIQNAMYEIIHQFKFSDLPFDELRLRRLAQQAIEADPTDVRGPTCAAFLEFMAGRLDRAIEQAKKANEMVPGYIEAHTQLGHLYLLEGRLEDARVKLERALDLSPNPWLDSYTLCFLGLYHALVGEFERAIEYSNQSQIAAPNDSLPLIVKLHALVELGREREAGELLLAQGPAAWEQMKPTLRGLVFRDKTVQQRLCYSLRRAVAKARQCQGALQERRVREGQN